MSYYVHRIRHYPVSAAWSVTKIALALFIVGGLITGFVSVNGLTSAVDSAVGGNGTGSPDGDVGDATLIQEGYDLNQTERLFLQYLNEERRERGRQNLSHRPVLTEMGRNHSRNMAQNDYVGHVEPDGDSIEDRYRQRGLLPECRLTIDGSDRFYPGAENAAITHVDSRLRADWADGGTFTVNDERDLANALFQMWMHSPDHRQAMLVRSADEAGLGLYIAESGETYASLELC